MSHFTDAEIAYLHSQPLGRLGTVDARGELHLVPVGFVYNAEHDGIDVGSRPTGDCREPQVPRRAGDGQGRLPGG